MSFNISILGLLLGAVVNMGLGALWYSNVLFAKPWMKEAGITNEDISGSQKGMVKVYSLTAVAAIITSFVIGVLVLSLQIDSLLSGLLFAVLLWAGTNIPTIIKNWGFEGRTIRLGIINHGYDLVVYVLVTQIYIFIS